ncbi:MAG: histidine kinase [Ruminococcaceae bacterium]|nr:histidine kinase [Oscillospiraceae bacterium]
MTKCLTLKKSNCKNCHKCVRHCPVKSIKFSGNQAHIIEDECILCGQCFVVCPQNAKEIVNDTEAVKVMIQSGEKVFVSLAPSYAANYDTGIDAMSKALAKLGFCGVEETARGAAVVKSEYERMIREEKRDIIISSCCHSVNLLIQKYFPEALPFLADVVSPMQAHCMDIKKRYPDAKTVFVGPCVSKKDEALRYPGYVDAVLTFDELSDWMRSENIEIEHKKEYKEESLTRLFPTTGGILKTMTERHPDYTYIAIDGVENCISAIKEILSGNIHSCFIEMSACVGSCIGGPIMEKHKASLLSNYLNIINFAGKKDFNVSRPDMFSIKRSFDILPGAQKQPSDYEITDILRRMGKFRPSDELNCGTCGYNTCREKAAAIYHGKAEISMCLPFLKEKAESFSDMVVKNTPNGLIVLNEELEVQQINAAARNILNIRAASDILGDQVVRILDPKLFLEVLHTGKNIYDRHLFLAEYKRYIEQSVIHDREYHLLLCVMRDITDLEAEKERKERISRQTVEVADKVVDKQMRIVQEIASLLGETAAETKIALSKLKESISDE